MDFEAYESNCRVETSIRFRDGAPAITGGVFPFDGSNQNIYFSVCQNLDIRAESGRVVMCPLIDFNFQDSAIYDYEVGQVMKALEIARARMERYHTLFNRFTQFDDFLSALDTALVLGRDGDAAQYLMLCPTRTEDAIDQALVVVLARRPTLYAGADGPLSELGCAVREFLSGMPDYPGRVQEFLARKKSEFQKENLI